ncbi:MAG TPA: methyl-accepting chemotaxis protein [Coleofasciculaceae cyanobacterium]|jgi:twitching motility protein PilJ
MSDHTNDLVSKIVEANALENAGEAEAAIALYQEILELDRGGNYADVAQQALASLQELSSSSVQQSQVSLSNSQTRSWHSFSLKFKVPFLIIALSIFPTIFVGATAYSLVNQLTTQTTFENENIDTAQNLAWTLALSATAVTVVTAGIGYLSANRLVRPIMQVGDAIEKLGQGDLKTRVSISGKDELADLGRNINKMAGQIEGLLYTQEAETKQQRREKELLQQGVMSLLLDVEGAQKGDLTVRAQMTDGAVGSIADAFNATMGKLRGLLQEVQAVSAEVGQLSLAGEDSVRQLSESAISQTAEINQALSSIDEINQSVETVANYAQEAAKIARNGSIQAREGDLAMDATVNSIEKIRDTVANTSKKVKQLAESSQEIAQIVEIISGISEKTNLLAFNASVEAARAGEHGEGFRIVAEEVRRLADRITEATKDIQELVDTIQQDTTSVLQGMETSTSEVVNGSELVRMTKLNLRSLAQTSKQIDEYLKYISTSTIDQTNTSQEVNQKISGIATLARTNSTEAQNVVQSLRTLVSEAENLQSSISQFKL